MNQQPSYCLDVFVGRDEHYREELLSFLQGSAATGYDITTVQRGRMGEEKSLRILTPKAHELGHYIIAGVRTGDDHDYEVHDSEIDAQRSMRFMPDYNNPLGDQPFDLWDMKSPDFAKLFDHGQQRVPRPAAVSSKGSFRVFSPPAADPDDSIY